MVWDPGGTKIVTGSDGRCTTYKGQNCAFIPLNDLFRKEQSVVFRCPLGQTINLINVNQFQSIFHDYAVGYGLSWLREWKSLNEAVGNAIKRSVAANYLV